MTKAPQNTQWLRHCAAVSIRPFRSMRASSILSHGLLPNEGVLTHRRFLEIVSLAIGGPFVDRLERRPDVPASAAVRICPICMPASQYATFPTAVRSNGHPFLDRGVTVLTVSETVANGQADRFLTALTALPETSTKSIEYVLTVFLTAFDRFAALYVVLNYRKFRFGSETVNPV